MEVNYFMNCTCGEQTDFVRSYRTTPDYPHYLHEYRCPKCGYFIMDSNDNFIRMGRIDDNGDDSHITGGYWI